MPDRHHAATVAALAAAAWALPAPAPHAPGIAALLGIRRRAAPGGGIVHLTFDDGPDHRATPAVLDLLAARHARATFFLVGEQVERDPSTAAEIAAAGHAVAVHGHRHRCQLVVPPRALDDDLCRAAALIGEHAAAPAPVHRPPYGVFSAAGLLLTRRRGWEPWLWSRWVRDWRTQARPADVARRAAGTLTDGDVVLLHDADRYSEPGSWRATVAALPRILDRLEEAGLRAVALR